MCVGVGLAYVQNNLASLQLNEFNKVKQKKFKIYKTFGKNNNKQFHDFRKKKPKIIHQNHILPNHFKFLAHQYDKGSQPI